MIGLSWSYSNQSLHEEGKKVCLKVYEKRDQMSEYLKIYTDYLYANYFKTPQDMINCLLEELDFDDQTPLVYEELGWNYNRLNQYDKTIPLLEKSHEIYKKWGIKPYWVYDYIFLGRAYHETGQFDKEEELYEKAEQDFPNDYKIIREQTILAFSEGDTLKANDYINQYISLRKEDRRRFVSEADITNEIASIYSDADILDKAEEYYRKSLELEPESSGRMNSLAYFLIDKDRNVNEGMKFADRALEINPDSFEYLDTKGWGLYKMGKYQEAFKTLRESWDLRLKNAHYDHEAFLHLEAAKKALAGMK